MARPGGEVSSSACPATPPSTSPRSGTARPRCAAATPTPVDDFDTALGLVGEADLGRLVSATYPLARYAEAIEHAADAGVRGAVKVAFDLRNEKERNR